jgi:hypothetical protein
MRKQGTTFAKWITSRFDRKFNGMTFDQTKIDDQL